MPVETSIYNRQRHNPLDTVGQVAGVANQWNQNRLFQQQFQSNLAAGQAYRQSIDPGTGQLDTNKLMTALASGPAAYTLPQVMKGVQEQRSRALQIETQKVELASKRLGTLRSTISSLLANPKASPKDVIDSMGLLVANGIATPQMVASTLQGMPTDPRDMHKWLTNHLVNTMTAQEKLNASYGQTQMVEGVDEATGAPVKRPVAMSPITGVRQLPVQGASGQDNPDGALQTGLAPGQQEAMVKSAESWQALRDDVGQSAERIFTLNEALDALGKAGTGKGSTWMNDVQSYAITLGWEKDPNEIKETAAYDKANKYLTQYAMRQSAVLGSGTDQKLATALSGNANTEISTLAAKDVVKANLALERMKQAQAMGFQESGLQPGQFSDWAVKWNRDLDPRAFMIDLIPANQRAKLLGGLKGNERAKFLSSMEIAINSGLVDPSKLKANG